MLTIKEIKALKPGEWRTDGGARGAGTLVFHASSSGQISGYFRHTLPTGKRYDMPLGLFDEAGKTGATLTALRERASELSRIYQSGIKDIRAYFAEKEKAEKEAAEAVLQAQEAEKAKHQLEAMKRERYTLRKLCEAYTGHLRRQGKEQSAKHAMSLFNVHIFQEAPELANIPAKEITRKDLTGLIRKTHEKGLVRAGGILRAYLGAAYSLAVNAEGDSQAPCELLSFDIQSNPVQGIKSIPVRSGERTLSFKEIKAYLSNLWDENLIDQFLLLHLLSAGQRASQLIRAHTTDFDPDTGVLRLWDPKGRRQEAREHQLPLGPIGCEIVTFLHIRAKAHSITLAKNGGGVITNPPLFLSTGGATMSASTPGKRVAEIATLMKVESFDLRDIRRTVETMLAGLGVSRDIRAQLLSHGLSGVQSQHYDRHQYMDEKKDALIVWEQHLEKILTSEDENNRTTSKSPLKSK